VPANIDFSILIPTFNNQDTIVPAIRSILDQTCQSFEILVVGDGAPPRTAELVREMQHADSRITYFANPKGDGHGERWRADVLKEAQGKYVAYLGDDDLWLPTHLSIARQHLAIVDFVQSAQVTVLPGGDLVAYAGDLENPITRQQMRTSPFNFFGPTTACHHLDAYRRLPRGWHARPAGMPSDLHMWRQWLDADDVTFKSLTAVTSLHFSAQFRRDQSASERRAELESWLDQTREPGFSEWLIRQQLHSWRDQIIRSISLAPVSRSLEEVNWRRHEHLSRWVAGHAVLYEHSAILAKFQLRLAKTLVVAVSSLRTAKRQLGRFGRRLIGRHLPTDRSKRR
jgi:glycosyltransferase involved in cell wall biosynthesis